MINKNLDSWDVLDNYNNACDSFFFFLELKEEECFVTTDNLNLFKKHLDAFVSDIETIMYQLKEKNFDYIIEPDDFYPSLVVICQNLNKINYYNTFDDLKTPIFDCLQNCMNVLYIHNLNHKNTFNSLGLNPESIKLLKHLASSSSASDSKKLMFLNTLLNNTMTEDIEKDLFTTLFNYFYSNTDEIPYFTFSFVERKNKLFNNPSFEAILNDISKEEDEEVGSKMLKSLHWRIFTSACKDFDFF